MTDPAEQAKIDMRTREGRALRPAMRSEDPRRDAVERAKQIMGSIPEDFGDTIDKFWFDPSKIPEGWGYEWKEYYVFGKIDPSRQIELTKMGWEPVPASRHPEENPAGSTETFIIRDGVRLMERPTEVTEMIRDREKRAAANQMRSKKEQVEGATRGPFDPTNKGAPLSRVKTGDYRPMAVPD